MSGNVDGCRSRHAVPCVLALIVLSSGNALAAELPGAEVRVPVATELKRLLEQEDTNGDSLSDLPIFLDDGTYVPAPLETTYQAAWANCPEVIRGLVDDPNSLA